MNKRRAHGTYPEYPVAMRTLANTRDMNPREHCIPTSTGGGGGSRRHGAAASPEDWCRELIYTIFPSLGPNKIFHIGPQFQRPQGTQLEARHTRNHPEGKIEGGMVEEGDQPNERPLQQPLKGSSRQLRQHQHQHVSGSVMKLGRSVVMLIY